MGKFTRHLAIGEKIIIDGEEFVIMPLGIEHLPDFFKAMKALSGGTKKGETEMDMDQFFSKLDEEGMGAISRLIDDTLKLSFPAEDEKERKVFGLRYMMELISKIFEVNSAMMSNPEIRKKLDSLKKNEPNKQA